MSDHLKTCERAARAAGAILMDWRGRFSVREKAPADLVTEADQASEQTVRTLLEAEFPSYAFLGEESSPVWKAQDSEYMWVVDPLDGTTNYVHGLPGWCVSVGLARGDVPICGCVYDPLHERCFLASRGEGAYLNGKRLKVSETTTIGTALVAISLPPQIEPDSAEIQGVLSLICEVRGFRRLGSAALNLAYLAAGNLDGYWSSSIHPWDMAAGALLVQEAGGIATSLDGREFSLTNTNLLAAATPTLHSAILPRVSAD